MTYSNTFLIKSISSLKYNHFILVKQSCTNIRYLLSKLTVSYKIIKKSLKLLQLFCHLSAIGNDIILLP